MGNNLLQDLLKAGLLDIGDSDERLENIEKSIADLETKLSDNNHLIAGYTMVALDPDINDSDPVLIEVETIIAEHWKALRGKFTTRPVTILRAVIIHALYNIGLKDPTLARIVFLTATNFFPYAKLGREKEIVQMAISELGNKAEEDATKEWLLNEEEPSLKVGSLKLTNLKFGSADINRDELKSGMKEAVSNEPTHGHGSNHGGNGHWGEHFANKSSDAITKAVNDIFQQFSQSLSPDSIETPINNFFTDFKTSFDQVLKSSFTSIQAVERRSKLLWWKETLYSSQQKNSYRNIAACLQPVMMAYDLNFLLPAIVPASVDYLLRDTVLLVNPYAKDMIPFSSWLEEIAKTENNQLLMGCFKQIEKKEQRITFTDFIKLMVYKKVEPSTLKAYTGIDPKAEVNLSDIAVMILHDFMVEALI